MEAENKQHVSQDWPAGDPHWATSFAASRDKIMILPRNPHSCLLYWEWTEKRRVLFEKGILAPEITIKLMSAEHRLPVAQFRAQWNGLKLYIEPSESGKYYYAALHIFNISGDLQTVLESNTVLVPRGRPGDGTAPLPTSSSFGGGYSL